MSTQGFTAPFLEW